MDTPRPTWPPPGSRFYTDSHHQDAEIGLDSCTEGRSKDGDTQESGWPGEEQDAGDLEISTRSNGKHEALEVLKRNIDNGKGEEIGTMKHVPASEATQELPLGPGEVNQNCEQSLETSVDHRDKKALEAAATAASPLFTASPKEQFPLRKPSHPKKPEDTSASDVLSPLGSLKRDPSVHHLIANGPSGREVTVYCVALTNADQEESRPEIAAEELRPSSAAERDDPRAEALSLSSHQEVLAGPRSEDSRRLSADLQDSQTKSSSDEAAAASTHERTGSVSEEPRPSSSHSSASSSVDTRPSSASGQSLQGPTDDEYGSAAGYSSAGANIQQNGGGAERGTADGMKDSASRDGVTMDSVAMVDRSDASQEGSNLTVAELKHDRSARSKRDNERYVDMSAVTGNSAAANARMLTVVSQTSNVASNTAATAVGSGVATASSTSSPCDAEVVTTATTSTAIATGTFVAATATTAAPSKATPPIITATGTSNATTNSSTAQTNSVVSLTATIPVITTASTSVPTRASTNASVRAAAVTASASATSSSNNACHAAVDAAFDAVAAPIASSPGTSTLPTVETVTALELASGIINALESASGADFIERFYLYHFLSVYRDERRREGGLCGNVDRSGYGSRRGRAGGEDRPLDLSRGSARWLSGESSDGVDQKTDSPNKESSPKTGQAHDEERTNQTEGRDQQRREPYGALNLKTSPDQADTVEGGRSKTRPDERGACRERQEESRSVGVVRSAEYQTDSDGLQNQQGAQNQASGSRLHTRSSAAHSNGAANGIGGPSSTIPTEPTHATGSSWTNGTAAYHRNAATSNHCHETSDGATSLELIQKFAEAGTGQASSNRLTDVPASSDTPTRDKPRPRPLDIPSEISSRRPPDPNRRERDHLSEHSPAGDHLEMANGRKGPPSPPAPSGPVQTRPTPTVPPHCSDGLAWRQPSSDDDDATTETRNGARSDARNAPTSKAKGDSRNGARHGARNEAGSEPPITPTTPFSDSSYSAWLSEDSLPGAEELSIAAERKRTSVVDEEMTAQLQLESELVTDRTDDSESGEQRGEVVQRRETRESNEGAGDGRRDEDTRGHEDAPDDERNGDDDPGVSVRDDGHNETNGDCRDVRNHASDVGGFSDYGPELDIQPTNAGEMWRHVSNSQNQLTSPQDPHHWSSHPQKAAVPWSQRPFPGVERRIERPSSGGGSGWRL